MENIQIVSHINATHYKWGQNSDGWHLLNRDDISVMEECMKPGSFEQRHFHERAQQFFYILSGEARFEIENKIIKLSVGDTQHVPPGIVHKIFNNSENDLRFIVISSPKSHGDRIDV